MYSIISNASYTHKNNTHKHCNHITIQLTSNPLVTLPKTVCLLSSQGVGTVVMKNCEPLVPAPQFAIDTVNGRSCLHSGGGVTDKTMR